MFLAENLKNAAKREPRIWLVKRKWAKPKPLLQAERENNGLLVAESSLFSVGEVFAIAKVKLLCSEVCRFATQSIKWS